MLRESQRSKLILNRLNLLKKVKEMRSFLRKLKKETRRLRDVATYSENGQD